MNPDDLLKRVTIPSPCTADWDSMEGDDHARFCRECGKSVINFRAISKEQAASLVVERGDGLCARITMSREGSMVNRPKLGALRFNIRSLIVLVAWVAAMLGFIRFIASSTVVAGSIRVPRRLPVSGSSIAPGSIQAEGCDEECEDGQEPEDK